MPRGDAGEGLLGAAPLLNSAIQQAQPPAQPTQQMQQPVAQAPDMNDLADLSYFNNRSWGGIGEEEINSDRGKTFLANLQKYDPTAKFSSVYGSEGNLMGYGLQFDPSKLPGVGGQPTLGGQETARNGEYASGSSFITPWSTVQDKMTLSNPNAVANANHYGQITSNKNIYSKPGWLDYVGPMVPLAFGGLMGGLPSILSAARGVQGTLSSMGSGGGFNPYKLAGAALPFIPGMNPFMASIGKIGLNYAGGR